MYKTLLKSNTFLSLILSMWKHLIKHSNYFLKISKKLVLNLLIQILIKCQYQNQTKDRALTTTQRHSALFSSKLIYKTK